MILLFIFLFIVNLYFLTIIPSDNYITTRVKEISNKITKLEQLYDVVKNKSYLLENKIDTFPSSEKIKDTSDFLNKLIENQDECIENILEKIKKQSHIMYECKNKLLKK